MAGSKGSKQSRGPGYPELFGRALVDLATQVFGGRMDRSAWQPEHEEPGSQHESGPSDHDTREKPANETAEAAEVLERALSQAETLLTRMEERATAPPPSDPSLQELIDLQHATRDVLQDLLSATSLMQSERERLSSEVSRLAAVAERFAIAGSSSASSEQETSKRTAEPAFAPGNGALDIIVGAVPGFQGLMDTQRGLTALPGVTSASVQSYRNGEASLEVVLRDPLTPAQVVDTLSQATGRILLIEEVRPDAPRLRLRFLNGT